MEFDPSIHDKSYLMANPSIAVVIAKNSDEFSRHLLAQDINILNLVNQDGKSVAYELAEKCGKWSLTEAGQRFDVLTTVCDGDNVLASKLAIQDKEWALSPAAQNFQLLSFETQHGSPVALLLALFQHQWAATVAATNFDVLSLSNKKGRSVAHQFVFNEKFSNILDSDRIKELMFLNYTTSGSVAQTFLYKYTDKVSILLRLVKLGAAYKTNENSDKAYRPTFTEKEIKSFITSGTELIEDECEEFIKLKMLIAIYSTLKNLEFDVKAIGARKLMDKTATKIHAEIKQTIASKPYLFENFTQIHDYNCEPATDAITKIMAEDTFQTSLQEQPSEAQHDTSFECLY